MGKGKGSGARAVRLPGRLARVKFISRRVGPLQTHTAWRTIARTKPRPPRFMTPGTPFPPPEPAIEAAVRETGERLLRLMDAHPAPGILSKKGAYARIMEWSMKDPVFKTQLFRFVDVLPSLNSSAEIVRHLQEYLGDKAVELHPALKAGLAASSFAPALVAAPVKAQIVDMAGQFVSGKDTGDLIKQIRKNAKQGLAVTIDLLGEAVVSEGEADVFLRRNREVLDSVSAFFAKETEPCGERPGAEGAPAQAQSVGQDLGPHAGGASGRSGTFRRGPEAAPAPDPAASRGGRGPDQLRHGKLQAEGPHPGAFQVDPGGTGVSREARDRDRAPGVPSRLRAGPEGPGRLGQGAGPPGSTCAL